MPTTSLSCLKAYHLPSQGLLIRFTISGLNSFLWNRLQIQSKSWWLSCNFCATLVLGSKSLLVCLRNLDWPDKNITRAIWGGKGISLPLPHLNPSQQVVRAGGAQERMQKLELRQRPCLHCIPAPLLTGSSFYTAQDHLPKGCGAIRIGWALPHQSPIKKMPGRLAYRPVWWDHFLSWCCLLPDDPSLYPFGKILTRPVL